MQTKTLIVRGVVFDWITRICTLVITFFLTPFLIHRLGDCAYGIWAIVMSLTNYYGLVDLGLRGAGTKYIAQFAAVDDRESLGKVLATSFAAYAVLSFIPLLIAAAIAGIFPYVFSVGSLDVLTVRLVVLITGINVSIQILGQEFGAVLVAMKRFDLTNMLAIGSMVIQSSLMALVLWSGGGLLGMAFAVLGVGVTTQAVQALLAKRQLAGIGFSWSLFDREMLRTLFRFGLLNVLVGLANRLTQYAGGVITGALIGPAAVTYYSIAEGLTRHGGHLAKGIGNIVLPVASQLESQRRDAELIQVLVIVPRAVLMLGALMSVVFIVFGQTALSLWIGQEYVSHSYPVLVVLTAAAVVNMFSGSIMTMLSGMGRMGPVAKLAVAEGLLTVCLGVLLGAAFGLLGVASAVLIAQVIARGISMPLYACKELEYPWPRFYVSVFGPVLVAAVPLTLGALILSQFWPADRLLVLFFQVLLLALVAGLSGFYFCFPTSVRAVILQSFRPRRRKTTESTLPGPVTNGSGLASADLEAAAPQTIG
jgi:O-antigen/teichoic acid export membrane protein